MINQVITNFHFLRPEWFFAIIPAIFVYVLLKYTIGNNSNWLKTINPLLLPYLIDEKKREVVRNPLSLILLGWCLAITSLAGPVWKKTDRPVHEREDALVIVFDLTKSMYAVDVSPNRLTRAQRKLQDLLIEREEGVTGLIVFAGDAHVVSPLTDDNATIISMIPAITPTIMPGQGSQLTSGLEKAIALFKDANVNSGRILIITDEIRDIANAQRVANEHRLSFPISVMSVGTQSGAAIPLGPDGSETGFLKDENGNLVIPKVDIERLKEFADTSGGRFSRMTLTDEDLDYLLSPESLTDQTVFREIDRTFDSWEEEGPWLLLLLLPLASLAFRKNWLWAVLILSIVPLPKTYAMGWIDLWQTKDQQGFQALQQGDAERASSLFEDRDWKASALYRNGQYEDAASQFSEISTSDGKYNLGNTLAKQGRLQEAVNAYAEALKLDNNNEDATFNKNLVENELKKRQQDQQNQSQNEDQDQQNQQNQSQNEDQDQQDQQNQSQNEDQNQDQDQDQDQEQINNPLGSEEKRALDQWLRRVPDNPGGLLQRKFRKQYADRLKRGQLSQSQGSNW